MFQCPAIIKKPKQLDEGSISMTVITLRELLSEEMTALFQLSNKEGWFCFKEVKMKLNEIDVPEIVPEFKTDKTPSQRLRGVVYRMWERTDMKQPFPDYWRKQSDIICDYLIENYLN